MVSNLVIISMHAWWWFVPAVFIVAIFTIYMYFNEQQHREQTIQHLDEMPNKFEIAGNRISYDLPIGILIYDNGGHISWHNPIFQKWFEELTPLQGQKIADLWPNWNNMLQEKEKGTVELDQRTFDFEHDAQERIVIAWERTDFYQLKTKYIQDRIVFLHIHMDNLDELSQAMDEQQRTLLMTDLISLLNDWADKREIYLRRTNKDMFFGVLKQKTLKQLEKEKFNIMEQVKELPIQNQTPITLSIGVGAGKGSLLELGSRAHFSLNIALGRGGDQTAIKHERGDMTFFGGRTNVVEKRTRVRARVIAHAINHIVRASDQVFIMGHQYPDMDSIGASIGILKVAQSHDRQGFLIMDEQNHTPGIDRLMQEIKKEDELHSHFISPQKALELKSERSVLFVVDVHKPELVIEPKLIDHFSRRVVVDHHRRGEDFIPDPLLTYMEPYASSTSELVTEILEYQQGAVQLSTLEATIMLAGIYVDTNGFTLRTGSRTFDAASYLRTQGADMIQVQQLLKEDKLQFIQRAQIVANTQFYKEFYAISVVGQIEGNHGQVLIAQAADSLLSLDHIRASFVLAEFSDGHIHISARSSGEVNVQVIMEQLHGGGHLTNAATKLADTTLQEAQNQLKLILDQED